MKTGREKGSSLIEILVAMALLGIISVSFLSGLATTSRARATADEQATSKILAESIMEQIKKQPYSDNYTTPEIPEEFDGYSVEITAPTERNGDIQRVVIVVSRAGRDIYTLENYKVDR